MVDETVYLAVNFMDRFLSQMAVLRGKLQLVGTAAMLISRFFVNLFQIFNFFFQVNLKRFTPQKSVNSSTSQTIPTRGSKY